MPNPQTLLEAVYRYEGEHGTEAARQLLAEAFGAAAARLLEEPKRLLRSTDRLGDTFKEEARA